MARPIGVFVNGSWLPLLPPEEPQPQPQPAAQEATNVVEFDPRSQIDRVAEHLASVVRIARELSPADARRVRDLAHAAVGALSAFTYLPVDDQHAFEKALRK